MPFEADFRLAPRGDFGREARPIRLLADGDIDGALKVIQADTGVMPARLREAQWLLDMGYTYEADASAQVIRWFRP